MEDEDTAFDTTEESEINAIDQADSSNPTAAANTNNSEGIQRPNLKNGGPPLGKKRKTSEVAQVQKRMDEAYDFLKQVAKKTKSTKNESALFCELLCVKLQALDEDTRANAMHDINNLMFNYRKPIKSNYILQNTNFVRPSQNLSNFGPERNYMNLYQHNSPGSSSVSPAPSASYTSGTASNGVCEVNQLQGDTPQTTKELQNVTSQSIAGLFSNFQCGN